MLMQTSCFNLLTLTFKCDMFLLGTTSEIHRDQKGKGREIMWVKTRRPSAVKHIDGVALATFHRTFHRSKAGTIRPYI